jgi:hypothetical protein
MRKPFTLTLTACVATAVLVASLLAAPAANAAPRSVGAARQLSAQGLLSPTIRFHFDGTGTIFAGGAVVEVNATYSCSPTIDSPVLPQLLGSYSNISFQVNEEIGNNITEGSINIFDLTCNGATQRLVLDAITFNGDLPIIFGQAAGTFVMKVCDLLGCTTAADVGPLTLSNA